ncbi:MAG: hypothetical protein RLZZ08_961 [Pseudomonadota bacterium]|jgi:8-oxo-dGTP pyrophosphatase MutT (NUDIX family)
MLHLTPAPLHRLVLRLGHAVRRTWWRLRRPVVDGACVIALDDAGHVLLLRQSYGTTRWVLPGGGVDRGETPIAAAARELEEEAGCGITGLELALVSEEMLHGATNRVFVFTGRLVGEPRVDGREILEAQLFPLHALPPETSTRVVRRMTQAGLYSSDS